VGSAAFKAVGTSEPRPAGSIPVHLRHIYFLGRDHVVRSAQDRHDC